MYLLLYNILFPNYNYIKVVSKSKETGTCSDDIFTDTLTREGQEGEIRVLSASSPHTSTSGCYVFASLVSGQEPFCNLCMYRDRTLFISLILYIIWIK